MTQHDSSEPCGTVPSDPLHPPWCWPLHNPPETDYKRFGWGRNKAPTSANM